MFSNTFKFENDIRLFGRLTSYKFSVRRYMHIVRPFFNQQKEKKTMIYDRFGLQKSESKKNKTNYNSTAV